jgi:hypothetical protein
VVSVAENEKRDKLHVGQFDRCHKIMFSEHHRYIKANKYVE